MREWRYWRLPERMTQGVSEREWSERVRVQLEESVRMQMVSDVPIGAFLSGGVDSSAVVGLMARHSQQPIRTYAIGFAGGEAEALYNELPYARRVAELFSTQHREILVRPDVVALLPKLLWHMDEPLSDTAFITTFLVSEFARQDVKVILSGVGGDELFGGYRRYLGGHYAMRYRRLPEWLRRSAGFAARHLPVDRHSGVLNTLRLAKGFLASAEMTADERYRSYLQVLDRQAVAALLIEPGKAGPDPLERAFAAAGNEDELNRMFAVDAETQLPDDLLLLTDKMSMAVSLECRVPLLDHQLVELAAAMPLSIKVRHGRLKHLMKASLADLLPDDILNRKKRGFGTPMGAWLKRELAPLLRRLLAAEVVNSRGLFHHSLVDRLMADHEASRIDGTDVLLALMNLEIWSRIYLDRATLAMSPTNSRATSHEHPLHLPPLSVSAQAGRQDPALQHDSPPYGQRSSGDRLFARALAAGSRGRAGDSTALRTFRDGAGLRPGADVADGRSAAAADAVVDGLFLFAVTQTAR
ncbi:MAG: asparagine synthase-related protein [Candidatus Accumulibacter necessarius]|uniref:asparagine synthetase B family protein n=1 Tax=Candidatus Accumulibacter necessarius TaxID=2954386 RepID=UPI002FC2DC1D